MKAEHFVALMILSAALMGGCVSPRCVEGSRNVVEETRDVGRYDSISILGSADLYITQGDYQPLRIEAEDNILDALRTDVDGGVLRIDPETCIRPREPIRIYATTEELEMIDASGSVNIVGESVIETEELELDLSGSSKVNLTVDAEEVSTDISGSGSVDIAGEAGSHEIDISGSGEIRAFDLETDVTEVSISGSGSAEVDVSRELDVDVSGSGRVFYEGSPSVVEQNVSGSGSITTRSGSGE